MKGNAKISGYKALVFMILILASGVHTHAQTEREQAKLDLLQSKIEMAEAKVADAEHRMYIADSLIQAGEKNLAEAEERYIALQEEQKELDREYKTQSKELRKLMKSDDAETAQKAESDLDALEDSYTTEVKAQAVEVRDLEKQAAKGQSDLQKGNDKKKDATSRLKEAEDRLSLAREDYEAYEQSLGNSE